MSQISGTSTSDSAYEIVGGRVLHTPDYVVDHTDIPKNRCPKIIGWSGPTRSGTTALLLLMASLPEIDHVYFQPQKTLLRKGGPRFSLSENDSVVCLKEVFGERYPEECYDPIDMLLKAGVPPANITWISFLRDPLQTFASWCHAGERSPQVFERVQRHVINHYYKYRAKGVNIIPFAYDLLRNQEEEVMKALFGRLGIADLNIKLTFDFKAIESKVAWGQATDERYFNVNIEPTITRRHFIYSRNNYPLNQKIIDALLKTCMEPYLEFYELSRHELNLESREPVKLLARSFVYT